MIRIHKAVNPPLMIWDMYEPRLLTFPGGEPHCVIDPERYESEIVWVEAHVGSMQDWGYLLVTLDALRRERPKALGLYIPYFPGARQDHPEPGTPYTLGIYAKALRGLDAIVIADPHSGQTPMALHADVISAAEILSGAPDSNTWVLQSRYNAVICPDAGALKRAEEVARALNIRLLTAQKTRNPIDGRLSRFKVEPLPEVGRYLVVDDICDGGATFIGLAKEIGKQPGGTSSILDLYVTHGIFSKGFKELAKHYERIITTDSFPIVNAPEDVPYYNTSVLVLPIRHHAEPIMQRRLMR